MATKGRSPTARRVWLWLDASAPREARALAVLDRMQENLPPRVRATLLRDAFCAALEQVAAELDENEQAAPPVPAAPKPETPPSSPEPPGSEVVASQQDASPAEPLPAEEPPKPAADDEPASPGQGGNQAKVPSIMW